MAKIKNPLDDFQLLTLSDESVYIANDDTVGVEQTTILINSAKPNIVNEETGEPYVVTGEELNAINRDDNSSYFDLYEKSDVYYYPECPGTEGGGTIISYEVGNVQYDSLLPATATGITVTWEYTATTQNPDGTTTTTTGTASKVIPIKPNTGDDDKTISGTIKVDGTDVEIPYEVTQKGKEYQDITSYEVSNVEYDNPIPSSATSFTVTWEYTMTYTDENGEEHTETGTDSRTIEIKPNTTDEDKTISGTIIVAGTEIPYELIQQKEYSKEYFTFVAIEDGTFKIASLSQEDAPTNYSLDNGKTWVELANYTDTPTVLAGQKIMWKATLSSPTGLGIGIFTSTGRFDVEGNIMSLLYGDDFKDKTDLTGNDYAFNPLFNECKENLISAKNLILPATILSNGCYMRMFEDCKNLVTAPELPATTLTIHCYQEMFDGCASLTTAPKLPATTLTDSCYSAMFKGCTSLTEAPELPATELRTECYNAMFNGCTSLTTAPELPAPILANGCYNGMFAGCSSLNYIKCLATEVRSTNNWVVGVAPTGTFIKADETEDWTIGVNGIPEGWVVKPCSEYEYLSFIALEDTEFWFEKKYCTGELYYSLDNGKTWVKELSEEDEERGKNTPVLHAGDKVMWKGTLTPTGMRSERRFNSTGKYNVSGNIMSVSYEDDFAEEKPLYKNHFQNFFAESKVVSAEKLYLQPTNLARGCYDDLFRDCEFLTLPPKLLATTLTDSCYSFMFAGCKSLTSNNLPELPATTLATYSYEGMFSRCTSITEVPKDYLLNVTKVINGGCYSKMFAECTGLTNVPDLPQIEGIDSVPDLMYSGMFSGCTSITEVPKDYLPLTKLGLSTYSYMFDGCTSLTTAPELPAPVLTDSCYYEMFKDCTSLNYIKCLATDISARYCTDNWVKNVAPTGTFVKAAVMSDWTIGVNGIPTGWEIEPDDEIVPDTDYFMTKYDSDGENPTIIYNWYMSTVDSVMYEGTDIKSQTTGSSVTCRGCYTFDEGEVFLKIGLSENIDDALYADFTETDIAECAVKEGIRHLRGSFGSCQSLRLVVLPSSITSIEGAFWGCNKLDKLDLTRVSIPPTIEENGFDSVGSDNFKIVVAAENLETYRTAQYWSKYADKIIAG